MEMVQTANMSPEDCELFHLQLNIFMSGVEIVAGRSKGVSFPQP
jgi:hypothetical protein